MYLKYQAKALYRLLNNNSVLFDHKSYDDPDDIPHIVLDGRRIDVYSLNFAFAGSGLRCCLKDDFLHEIIINLDNSRTKLNDEEFDKQLNSMGLDELFHDMYYETDESYSIGDYELDFLGLYPENLVGYEGLTKEEMISDIANIIGVDNSWDFPTNTFISFLLWGIPTKTELKHFSVRETEGGTKEVELYSVDDVRNEEQYTDTLSEFSVEEIRQMYVIFKRNQ